MGEHGAALGQLEARLQPRPPGGCSYLPPPPWCTGELEARRREGDALEREWFERFLKGLVDAASPAAKRLAIATLKPVLCEKLPELDLGLTWSDVLPALELVDTAEELQDALIKPDAFLEQLQKAGVKNKTRKDKKEAKKKAKANSYGRRK